MMNVVFLNNDDLITNLQAIATACEQQQSIIFDTKFINLNKKLINFDANRYQHGKPPPPSPSI